MSGIKVEDSHVMEHNSNSETNKTLDFLEFVIQHLKNNPIDDNFMESLTNSFNLSANDTHKHYRAITFINHIYKFLPGNPGPIKEYWKFVSDMLPIIIPIVGKDKSISEEELWDRIGRAIGAITPHIIRYVNTNIVESNDIDYMEVFEYLVNSVDIISKMN